MMKLLIVAATLVTMSLIINGQQEAFADKGGTQEDVRINSHSHHNDNNGNEKINCDIQTVTPHVKQHDETAVFGHIERDECG
jgi:cellobiose-specific phosphotransferase system component IIB